MIEIYVLDSELHTVGVVDAYRSLIWASRYQQLGDCELYLEASAENITLLSMGFYLARTDDDMVCKINKIELQTDVEQGNYMIVTGTDTKDYLRQRIVWDMTLCNGNAEEFVRKLITDAIINPADPKRAISFIELGTAAGFTETLSDQVAYSNLGDKVQEYCKTFGWGYKFKLNNSGHLVFELYRGADRSREVIFSDDYENLSSTKYTDSAQAVINSVLIGGQGEGDLRIMAELGDAEGADRSETFVNAQSTSKNINYGNLTSAYPNGQIVELPEFYGYRLPQLDVQIMDATHKAWLLANYEGTIVAIEGVEYYRMTNVIIADLRTSYPTSSTSVTLRDIIYHSYLLSSGSDATSGSGRKESFEGSIISDVTFIYKRDYYLGDIVHVENEFGIGADARITEVLESVDDNGYRVEPRFEYIS